MKKRVLSLVLVVAMLVSVLPGAQAANAQYGSFKYTYSLTGNGATDMVNIAKAQHLMTGKELGYTDQWCAYFVSDCARLAGQTAAIPASGSVKTLYNNIVNAGGTKITSGYKPGDIIVYDTSPKNGVNNWSHIEIIYKVSGSHVYSVGGNTGDGKNDGTTYKTTEVIVHEKEFDMIRAVVRPAYKNNSAFTLSYNANGGSGSMSNTTAVFGNTFALPSNAFTRSGYTFTGWNAKRSDGTWYVKGKGWFTDAEIKANGYTKAVYENGYLGTFDASWTKGAAKKPSITFYAQWKISSYTVNCYDNYAGKNYFQNSSFWSGVDSDLYYSRDTSVYKIYEARTECFDVLNPPMKIEASAPGSSGKDMAWKTTTNASATSNGSVGDNKFMVLSFWAKSSVDGAKMYIRWGYQPTSESVQITLKDEWTFYSLRMPKSPSYGNTLHPYFDKAGSFWICKLQLEDGFFETDFVAEYSGVTSVSASKGGTYSNLPTPTREGYTFLGWYTARIGGNRVDASTAVKDGNINLYAHWEPVKTEEKPTEPTDPTEPEEPTEPTEPEKPTEPTEPEEPDKPAEHRHNYTGTVIKVPNTDSGIREYTCTSCGGSYREALRPIVENCSGGAECPSEKFADVGVNDWHHVYVDYALEHGLMKGTGETTFEPDSPMTRAMLVTVLWRFAGEPNEGSNVFTDVPDGQWYTAPVAWAAHNGVVNGVGNGKFEPDANITREQLASILYRYCQKRGMNTGVKLDLSAFPDSGNVSDWAVSAVMWAVNEGLIAGSDGYLLPQGNATRAQVATMLARFIEYVVE